MTSDERKEYISREDIVIQGNIARWNINTEGKILGSYKGTFEFACYLSPSTILACGRLYRQLLGEGSLTATEHEESLAYVLSQLKYRVLKYPPFWSSYVSEEGLMGNIPDQDVLNQIFDNSLTAQFKYMAMLEEKKEKALSRAKKAGETILEEKDKDVDNAKEE